MGYRIAYSSIGKRLKRNRKKSTAVVAVLVIMILVIGAIAVKSIGLTWVKEVLLPGDPNVTAAALEDLAENLRNGESIGDAIRVFCQEIIEHGTAE